MHERSTAENNRIDEARSDRRRAGVDRPGHGPKQSRDCDRCGRPRPGDPTRFTVTMSDFTPGTADYEQALLCGECWRYVRDELWRCLA